MIKIAFLGVGHLDSKLDGNTNIYLLNNHSLQIWETKKALYWFNFDVSFMFLASYWIRVVNLILSIYFRFLFRFISK